jgi:hypothetical protein
MGDDDPTDVFFFAFEVGHVWNDVINARHILFRKLQSHVNDDDVIFVFD